MVIGLSVVVMLTLDSEVVFTNRVVKSVVVTFSVVVCRGNAVVAFTGITVV